MSLPVSVSSLPFVRLRRAPPFASGVSPSSFQVGCPGRKTAQPTEGGGRAASSPSLILGWWLLLSLPFSGGSPPPSSCGGRLPSHPLHWRFILHPLRLPPPIRQGGAPPPSSRCVQRWSLPSLSRWTRFDPSPLPSLRCWITLRSC